MSAIKIDKKIAKYRVQKPEDKAAAEATATAVAAAVAKFEPAVEMTHDKQGRSSKVVRMTEEVQRPEMLVGSTYKIKTPVSDHAMYVTINDIILNEGTPYEQRRPFEVFINSKNAPSRPMPSPSRIFRTARSCAPSAAPPPSS